MMSHPFALLRHAAALVAQDKGVALVFVTRTIGGSVRMPGLRMIVDSNGVWNGSVSNGCLEADIAARAREALRLGQAVSARYGQGSGNIDIRLPCGGAIDLLIVPLSDRSLAEDLARRGLRRETLRLAVWENGRIASNEAAAATNAPWMFDHHPPIRLLIVGTGAEASSLLRLATSINLVVELMSPSPELINLANAVGATATLLKGLGGKFELRFDPLTSVVVLFHDHEWEREFLVQALPSSAFYVGALGSHRISERRHADLKMSTDLSDRELDRLKAPTGLIPRMREPELLAVSVLAEIVAEFSRIYRSY